MNTQNAQTISAAHAKAICILSMIEKADAIINGSKPYLDESRKHLCYYEPVAKFHTSVISRYTAIKERLAMAYDNISFSIFHMQLPCIMNHESMLPY